MALGPYSTSGKLEKSEPATNRSKMIDLATQMNKKITGEDKRLRRKAACLKYGLKFLAECFERPTA